MIDKVSNIQEFLLGRGWHPTEIYMQKDRSSSAPNKGDGRLDLSFIMKTYLRQGAAELPAADFRAG